jgi:hypothetical protein
MRTKPDSLIHSFEGDTTRNFGGLTKREYFAAMAMQGIQDQEYIPLTEVARMAVKQADALIEALNAEAEGE